LKWKREEKEGYANRRCYEFDGFELDWWQTSGFDSDYVCHCWFFAL